MSDRICIHCAGAIPEDRPASKYCSDSCRSRYSEKKRGLKGTGYAMPPLRHNVPSKEQKPVIEPVLPSLDYSTKLEGVTNTVTVEEPLQQPEQPKQSAIENLRGLIDDENTEPGTKQEQPKSSEPPKMETKIVEQKVRNSFVYDGAANRVYSIEQEVSGIKQEITYCEQQIEQAKNDNGLNPFGVALLSGYLGFHVPDLFRGQDPLPPSRQLPAPGEKRKKKKRYYQQPVPKPEPSAWGNWLTAILIGAAAGIGTNYYNKSTQSKREQERQQIIVRNQQRIQELNEKLKRVESGLAKAKTELSGIPEYVTVRKEIKVPVTQVPGTGHVQKPTAAQNDKPDNVVSSMDMKMQKGRRLNFQGEWQHFFGQPSILFHLVIHGLPGEGKSTFAIMLAKYLADNFGRVLYISAEERKDETLIMKLDRLQARSKYLDFPEPDVLKFEEIKERYKQGVFNFIFIDSLTYLYIDTDRLRELKEIFKDAAFITICMSTKDGKMRGSQEIVHDADIVVHVQNGIATTTKNRFKPKDQKFKIFDSDEGEGAKVIPMNPPRNVI